MKNLLSILIFCISLGLSAQENPVTVATLSYGSSLDLGQVRLKILNIVDSRCPKSVMCIRAGDAEVLVEIYENGKFLKVQQLIFPASGTLPVEEMNLYTASGLSITGVTLIPYPEAPDSLKLSDYEMVLNVKESEPSKE